MIAALLVLQASWLECPTVRPESLKAPAWSDSLTSDWSSGGLIGDRNCVLDFPISGRGGQDAPTDAQVPTPSVRPSPNTFHQLQATKALNAASKGKQNGESLADTKADVVFGLSTANQFYVGKDVFTIAEIECRDSSNFLRGWWAQVTAADNGSLRAKIREHLAISHNKDAMDRDGNPDNDSVYYGDYWCVPKKAWCYKTLSEKAFGSEHLIGSVYELSFETTAAVESRLLTTFKQIILRVCEEN